MTQSSVPLATGPSDQGWVCPHRAACMAKKGWGLLIKRFGCKWTIVISMCCYVAFSLGNFYASWYSPHGSRPGLAQDAGSCSGALSWSPLEGSPAFTLK